MSNNNISNYDIDVVYTYVNSRDTEWINKYKKYKNINEKNHRNFWI